MKKLPSYQDCVRITQENENFYEKKTVVNGVDVSIFNYRLATYDDFEKPLKDDSSVDAFELRGITFIHESEESKRYLMLHKFFNLNQVRNYQYDDVKFKKVVRVADKADGSMIRFLRVKDQIVAKTKGEFITPQAALAKEVLDKNSKIRSFVEKTLDQNLCAVFEIVGMSNQIVIPYEKTELILLQLREEDSGKYFDIYNHELVKEFGIKTASQEPIESLESFLSKREFVEGIEGWIITLEDGQMLKVKTQWYLDRHGLLTSSMVRENDLIGLVLTETLDDAMTMIVEGDPRRVYAEAIQKSLAHFMEKSFKEIIGLMKTFNGSKKDFALNNRSHPWFDVAIKHVENQDEDKVFNLLKDRVIFKNRNLMEAKSFVKEVLGVAPVSFVMDEDN